MKQWRKLTGGGGVHKGKLQGTAPLSFSAPQQNAALFTPSATPSPTEEVLEVLAGEDSIEDEFRRGMQEVHLMRTKYAGLLEVAGKMEQSAKTFSEASQELASFLADNFGTMQESDIGDVFLSSARVEEEIAQLLQKYAGHVKQTIFTPTENLLRDLEQVEETKKQYEEKRHAYEQKLIAAKIRPKNGRQDMDVPGKEEFDEIAMTLGCRLLSLDQRRPRNLLTQLVRHHTAQMLLFKRGFARMQAMEATIQRVVREKNISRKLMSSEVEDEEGDDEGEDMDDEDDEEDGSSSTASEGPSSQDLVGSRAESGEFSNDPGGAPVMGEVEELPKDMPVEWSSLLSSLDQTLKGIGAETMDVGDAVFAMNAVLSAAAHSGKDASVLRKFRGLHGSYSAPLSADGIPLSRHKGGKIGDNVFQPRTADLARRLPPGYGADPIGTAAYHVTLPPSTPPRSATLPTGLGSQPHSQNAGLRPFNFRPTPVSMSGPLPQPRSMDSFIQTAARPPPSAPNPRGASVPSLPKAYVSRSGPILSSVAKQPRVSPVLIPPFAMHMSGPLPSPSAVEKAAANQAQSSAFGQSQSLNIRHSSPQWPTNSNTGEISESQKRSRPRYYSGPIDASNFGRSATVNPNNARRAESLYKSGPIGRSPLSGLLSPSSSPPHISELHRLPPPPLNSSPPLASISSSSAVSHAPNVAPLKSSSPMASPLPLPTPSETRSSLSSSAAPLVSKSIGRSFGVSKKPSVPTILSEGSEEGESPGKSSSPRLYRSLSLSSTESGASTIAPLRSEEFSSYNRALDRQGSANPQVASVRSLSFSAPVPMIVGGEKSTLQALGSKEREQLLAQVSRDDFQWQWLEDNRPNSVPTVPLWRGMPHSAKESLLKALASAVLTRRSSDGQTPLTSFHEVVAKSSDS